MTYLPPTGLCPATGKACLNKICRIDTLHDNGHTSTAQCNNYIDINTEAKRRVKQREQIILEAETVYEAAELKNRSRDNTYAADSPVTTEVATHGEK